MMTFRLPWFDFEFGRALAEWGPGARGNLMVSRNANFYDLLKLTFRYNRVKFEYFHGWLNASHDKYLAGHRLEIRPSRSLQLAVSESVVYGNRGIEPLYLNAFVLFLISERHLGNQDNNSISFDGAFFLHKYRMKFYAEAFVDDFSFAKDLFRNFVNKWAVLGGFHYADPFGFRNLDFRIEAVRIQPFVYTHTNPVNAYTNYNNVIGHWLGPDADDWFFELGYQMTRDFRFALAWERRRRGQNDVNDGIRPEDDVMEFLGGVVERNQLYGLSGQWQVFRDIFISASYQYIRSRNLYGEEGPDQNNHRFFFRLAANF
jgi:hypothetical protein